MREINAPTLTTPQSFSWDSESEIILLPRETGETLDTLAEILRNEKPNTLINILPSLWQLEPLLSDTCKRVRVPLMSVQEENIPLALKMYELLDAESIVGTQKGLNAFFAYANEKQINIHMRSVVLVAAINEKITLPMHHNVYIERQTMPGRTCLYQCAALVPHVAEYHLADCFDVTIENDHIIVVDTEKKLPPKRYDITITDGSVCVCGNRIIRYKK